MAGERERVTGARNHEAGAEGALTLPQEIEHRLQDAGGNLCLITAGRPEEPLYQRLPALVESVVPGQVLTVRYLATAPELEQPCPVQLEIISESAGLMRFHSRALGGTGEMLIVALAGRLEVDRRRWPRIQQQMPVQVGYCDEEWQEQATAEELLQDLSPLGAALATNRSLPLGQRLILRIGWELPPLRGQVVRSSRTGDGFVVGVVFNMTNDAIRRFLIRHLAERP